MPHRKVSAVCFALLAPLPAAAAAPAEPERALLSVSAVVTPACTVTAPARAPASADLRRLARAECSAGAEPRIEARTSAATNRQGPAARYVTLTY